MDPSGFPSSVHLPVFPPFLPPPDLFPSCPSLPSPRTLQLQMFPSCSQQSTPCLPAFRRSASLAETKCSREEALMDGNVQPKQNPFWKTEQLRSQGSEQTLGFPRQTRGCVSPARRLRYRLRGTLPTLVAPKRAAVSSSKVLSSGSLAHPEAGRQGALPQIRDLHLVQSAERAPPAGTLLCTSDILPQRWGGISCWLCHWLPK